MTTKVVCVKVNDIRPKYQNLKEWISDEDNIYIARKGVVFVENDDGKKCRYPPQDSIWANPFKVKDEKDRKQVIDKYRNYIKDKIVKGVIPESEIEKLRGKNLGCWCKVGGENIPCHGDVLLELLN